MSITPSQFHRQVKWLKDQGFKNMRMAELESLSGDITSDLPRVIFSFDDGYEDNYLEALPVLKEFGYSGIFYLTVDYISTDRMFSLDVEESSRLEHNRIMSWEQSAKLIDQAMEIGSHSLSHDLLISISAEQAEREIFESKQRLEEQLRTEITSFCYPGGYCNDLHVDLCKKAGYRSACTADPGIWQSHDTYRIPRISVLRSDNFFVFKQKVLGKMEWLKFIH